MLPRCLIGAALGTIAWAGVRLVLPVVPAAPRFVIVWLLFSFGPGAAAGVWLTRDLDVLRRTIVLLAIGSGATSLLIDLLGRVGMVTAYPWMAVALAGASVSVWSGKSTSDRARTSRADLAACVIILGAAAGAGAVAFGHRLVQTPDETVVYGNYDSFDLSYYAAIASEASHTVPPTASFYAGHHLNAAYYPQLVLAMVHRFADVPLLAIYFRYSWPAFLSLGALTIFVLVRSLAPPGVSLLAVLLILVGGDFSYLAAWLLPHATDQWDYMLWPTNFLAPTMEVLHFNTWAPTLAVFFGAVYAVVRGLQTRARGWTVVAAVLIAVLFQFKPFAYAVLMAGLCAAAVFARRDDEARWRFGATVALGVLFVLPFLYEIARLHGDQRSRLLLEPFLLPQRMLLKLDLTATFASAANRIAPIALLRRPLFLLMATALFLIAGPGVRWGGVPRVWRALWQGHGPDASAWRLLAWTATAGVGIPFVLVTDPYVDTLQFYQTGLYLLWIFTAAGLVSFVRAHRRIGVPAVAVAVALTLPSSIHYLARKWTDNERPPIASLSRSEAAIARYLRTCDPEATVVLVDRPTDPSLLAIVSERRVVLAWGHPYYAVGSGERQRDVNRFFASAGGGAQAAVDVLRRYHVTHVVVRGARDHVHPDMLAGLQPVIQSPDVSLYAVPAASGQ